MEKYRTLTYDEAVALSPSTKVYLTWSRLVRTPAFTFPLASQPQGMGFVFGEEITNICTRYLPFRTYGDEWTVEVENGFTVETPDGVLHAFSTGSSEYPGVYVDLYRPGDDDSITLSLTEYTPGGEGVFGYDREHPSRQNEEFDEVPTERIVDKDGKPISSRGDVTLSSGHTVTAGLVTRVWPDEAHDQDYHKRVFHIGYKEERK